MRRVYTLLITCCLTISSWAQTQQGYVKTLGRPNQKGMALSGVTIRVKGGHNAVLSKNDGTFSMVINGDSYSLQQVQKSGYELNDVGVIGRQQAYSANVPLTVVMVSTQQLQTDKQRIENNAYQVAEKNYKERIAQLEKQKTDNAITSEQYRQLIQELQNKFEKYQSLIDGLADHYAHVDYDELDEKEHEINLCIENGDLERANQLLQQNGIQQRIADIENRLASGKSLMDEAKADMTAVLKQQEKDAEYLFQLYTISTGKLDFEKARFYIETRAELDTTNLFWQQEAAYFCDNQLQYPAAVKYYERSHRLLTKIMQDHLGAYYSNMEATLTNLGLVYLSMQQFDKSEAALSESLDLSRKLAKDNPERYNKEVAEALLNLGNLYCKLQRLKESETMYQEALVIQRQLANDAGIVMVLNNLASLYIITKRYAECEAAYKEALDIQRHLSAERDNNDDPELARLFLNIGTLYTDVQRFEESHQMLSQALSIYRHLAKDNPQVYEPDAAKTLNNIGHLYFNAQQFAESETSYKESLVVYRKLAKAIPHAYEPEVAMLLNNLAALYKVIQRLDEAEAMYKEALDIRHRLAKDTPAAFDHDVATTQYNLGQLLVGRQRYTEAITSFEEAVEIYRSTAKENPADVIYLVGTLYRLSNLYLATNNYTAAYDTYHELLPLMKNEYEAAPESWRKGYALSLSNQSLMAIFKQRYKEAEQLAQDAIAIDSSQQAIYTNLAAALLLQGDYTRAEAIYRQYKDSLKDGILEDLKQFAEAGVIPEERKEDVERIKRMLNE